MGVGNLTIAADSVNAYLGSVGVVDPYMRAAVVLFVFIVLGQIVKYLFKGILSGLVSKTETEFDDKIIDATQTPVFFLVSVIGLFFSGKMLDLDKAWSPYFLNIFQTIASFLIFLIIFRIILLIVHSVRNIKKSDVKLFKDKIFPVFEKGLKVLLGIIYVFVFFSIWNINLTPLLASAGIVGIAVAFAAQESIANIFGGISLFLDKTYQIGDFVIVDDKERGEVVDIGLRSTKIKTRDDVLVVLPNSVMASSKVVNESGIHLKMRVRIDIGVAYDSDLDKVEKVLMDIAKKSDYIEQDPEPRVRFRTFGDSAINLQFMFWIKKPVYKGRYKSFMIKEIHKRFGKEKIEIPFPTRDLNIRKGSVVRVKK